VSTSSKPFDWSYYIRAQDCIAQTALTNSKRIDCLVKGVYPTHLTKGLGCHVWDTSGKKYVDFICGLGTNLLGYAEAEVTEAICTQARRGASFSLGTPLELEVAEKVKELFPFVTHLRFLKTGSEACLAALRIARAKTKRSGILSHGYHGWGDEFVFLSPPALGVPRVFYETTGSLGDISQDETFDGVAAVIVEPVMADISQERIEWLNLLREKCTKNGTLLIFDEIITGFRFPGFSASRYFGIEPDLICLGKAIANGMPLSVVAGKKDVMNCDEYFVSSTFAGETLSLAAALKTMTLIQTNKYDLQTLWEQGTRFLAQFNSFWPKTLAIQGYPTRGIFTGDPLTKALFWQEACKAGILFGPSWFFNFKHIEHSDAILSTCQDIIARLKTSEVKLEGEMPQSPFAQKIREQS
jgi:glutamate-1-semialdehyde 2,1-aminomutase